MNAIVIREFRQAVRSKIISAILLMFLLVQCATAGWLMLEYSAHTGITNDMLTAGRDLFIVLYGILVGTCMVCVPLYTGVRLAVESTADNPDLYFLSTLTPHAVVRGKMLSAAGITLLLFSVGFPFLSLSQAMRGIDLLTVLLTLVTGFAAVMLAVMGALLIGSLREDRVLKILVGLMGMGALASLAAGVIAMSYAMVFEGLVSSMFTKEFWQVTGCILGIYLAVCGVLYICTVASLMPQSANWSLLVRGYFLGLWAVSGIVFYYIALDSKDTDIMGGWVIVALCAVILSLVLSSVEPGRLSARVRRRLPRIWLLRLPVALLSNGPATGMLLTMLIAGLTLVLAPLSCKYTVVLSSNKQFLHDCVAVMSVLYLYWLGAVMLANMLCTAFMPHVSRRVIVPTAAAVLIVFSIAPYAYACVAAMHFGDDNLVLPWRMGSIVNLLEEMDDPTWRAEHVMAGSVFAFVALMLNIPWLGRQLRQYAPVEAAQ